MSVPRRWYVEPEMGSLDLCMSMAMLGEERFLQWLTDHGAQFHKIRWPRLTPSGLRGATATAPIATHEIMLSVPQSLMISEATCWRDPALRRVYDENRDLFCRDDPVLVLFLMQELVKGETSFYFPYLSILPQVETVADWTTSEQTELRDPLLIEAATRRTMEMTACYRNIMRCLQDKYPNEFPVDEYTFARFQFAWKTIQARTFGRRLPWTALVPFADCLNHANVATKYDFDVDGNGMFRLFPSASTQFDAGAEVFNSYGRRPNSELLLAYGFALDDNEWDYVDVELPRETAQMLGRRFSFRKRLRLDRETTVEMIFPFVTFPNTLAQDPDIEQDAMSSTMIGEIKSRRDALLWLRTLVVETLERFETTLEDDELRLVDDRLAERMHMAIVYRVGRMRILDRFLRDLEKASSACDNG